MPSSPLPCPFCGTLPQLDAPDTHPGSNPYHFVACYGQACPVQPETPGKTSQAEAIEAWNTRTLLPSTPCP